MQDPRIIALEAINLLESRVEFAAPHILLLCGGPAPTRNNPDEENKIVSLRHALVNSHDHTLELFRPEDVTDWQTDANFHNLIDLEVELAAICSLVIIILESPGAIAELGAFSQLEEFQGKIILINNEQDTLKDSFINLGLVRHVTAYSSREPKTFPWDKSRPGTITDELIEDVLEDLSEEVAKLPKSQKISERSNSHQLIAIYELLGLFTALKEHEIHDFLLRLGINITKDSLKRKLLILQRFKIVRKEIYSDSTFYVKDRYEFHRISFSIRPEHQYDSLRVETQVSKYYLENPKEKHRLRVMNRLKGARA